MNWVNGTLILLLALCYLHRKVFPRSLSTKITVAGTIVYMIAGLAKKTTPTPATSARDTVVTFVPQERREPAKLGQSVKLDSSPTGSSVTSQTRLTGLETGLTSIVSTANTTKQEAPVSSEVVGVSTPAKVGVSSSHDVGVSCKSIGIQATSRALHSATPTQTTPLKSSVQSSNIRLVSRAASPLSVSRKAIDVTSSEMPLPVEVKGQTLAVEKHNSIPFVSDLPLKAVTRESSSDYIPPAKRIKLDNCVPRESGGDNHVKEMMVPPAVNSLSGKHGAKNGDCKLPVNLDIDKQRTPAISYATSHDQEAIITESNAVSHDQEAIIPKSNTISRDIITGNSCVGNEASVFDDALDITVIENNGGSSTPGTVTLTDDHISGSRTNIDVRTKSVSPTSNPTNSKQASDLRTIPSIEHTSDLKTKVNAEHTSDLKTKVNAEHTSDLKTKVNTEHTSDLGASEHIITSLTNSHTTIPLYSTAIDSNTVPIKHSLTPPSEDGRTIFPSVNAISDGNNTESTTASPLTCKASIITGATSIQSSTSTTLSTQSTCTASPMTCSKVSIITGATSTSITPNSSVTATPLTTPSNSTDTSPNSRVSVQSDRSMPVSIDTGVSRTPSSTASLSSVPLIASTSGLSRAEQVAKSQVSFSRAEQVAKSQVSFSRNERYRALPICLWSNCTK